MDSALRNLGAAIHEEVQKEVAAVRKELDQERQVRQLVEQQLLRLQHAVYSNVETDRMLEALQKRLEERSEIVREDCERALRAAQRELERRIEVLLQRIEPKEAPEVTKPRITAEDAPLLSHEIDRKLGTVLVDVDQRLEAAHADTGAAVTRALQIATNHADEGLGRLSVKFSELESTLGTHLGSLQKAVEMHTGVENRLMGRLEAAQVGLEQKIGMVQLDLDQVRLDFSQRFSDK